MRATTSRNGLAELAGSPSSTAVAVSLTYWVQDAKVNGIRKAIIHLGHCPLCDEGSSGSSMSARREWYGPFGNIDAARRISDTLDDIAVRSECRCVRNAEVQATVKGALLNEAPAKKAESGSKKQPSASAIETAAAEAEQAVLNSASETRKASNKKVLYIAVGLTATVVLAATLFFFPAVSVVEASNRGQNAPFLLANAIPLAITDLNADCSLTFGPTSAHLKDSHAAVTGRLGTKDSVNFPCFQAGGGGIPQTGGVTLQVNLSYAVLGIHHAQQTFSFVAARSTDGLCRWVKKE